MLVLIKSLGVLDLFTKMYKCDAKYVVVSYRSD